MKKKLLFIFILVLVVFLIVLAVRFFWRERIVKKVIVDKVKRIDLNITVSASGQVISDKKANISSKTGGKVERVYVSEGEMVEEGDLILTLDSRDLKLAVNQARVNLQIAQLNYENAHVAEEIAQANLDKIKEGAKPEQIEVSEVGVEQAQEALEAAQRNLADVEALNADSLSVAQLSVDSAQEALNLAKKSREEVYNRTMVTDAEKILADQQYQQAESSYLMAKRNLESIQITNQQRYNSAKAQVENARKNYDLAQAQLNLTKSGATPLDIKTAEKQVIQASNQVKQTRRQVELANIGLKTAKVQVSNATLYSPIDGLVVQVNISPGEIATPGLPLVLVVSPNDFLFEVLVDEGDIAQLKEGMEAQITLDAYPDQKLKGKVCAIGFQSKVSPGGATSFPVKIKMEEKTENISFRLGMNGDADIIIGKRKGLLVIPLLALVERDEKELVFVVNPENIVEERIVRTGYSTEDYFEIKKGLKEGELIVVEGASELKSGDRVRWQKQ